MELTSHNLLLPGIAHGFFTREGGVSEGIYASLNCGLGSRDVRHRVVENRNRVLARLTRHDDSHLCSLYQVHGNEVVTVSAAWGQDELPEADAMVTAHPYVALGILTADCLPVLLADSAAGVVGAVHAGWKGAYAGIIPRAVEAMVALGANASAIQAALGPCIGPASFAVAGDFRDKFITLKARNERFFTRYETTGQYHFDLRAYAADALLAAGVEAINRLENDTYIEEDRFFSFRRATHRKEEDYGRQISVIMLTDH